MSSHASCKARPSALLWLECFSHCRLCTFRSPRMILPRHVFSNALYSDLNVVTVPVSPGAGGLYHTPTRCGPWSACSMSQNLSASSELWINVTRSAMSLAASAAIPPPWRPSLRSRLATSVYPSSVICSKVLSRKVSFTHIKFGFSFIRRSLAASSATCETQPRMLTCSTRNFMSCQVCRSSVVSLLFATSARLLRRSILNADAACERGPLLRMRGPG